MATNCIASHELTLADVQAIELDYWAVSRALDLADAAREALDGFVALVEGQGSGLFRTRAAGPATELEPPLVEAERAWQEIEVGSARANLLWLRRSLADAFAVLDDARAAIDPDVCVETARGGGEDA